MFQKLWRWLGPERFRIILWKVSLEALVTNCWRKRRNLDKTGLCPTCGLEEERIIHLVRDCPIMQQVWLGLKDNSQINDPFFLQPLMD